MSAKLFSMFMYSILIRLSLPPSCYRAELCGSIQQSHEATRSEGLEGCLVGRSVYLGIISLGSLDGKLGIFLGHVLGDPSQALGFPAALVLLQLGVERRQDAANVPATVARGMVLLQASTGVRLALSVAAARPNTRRD